MIFNQKVPKRLLLAVNRDDWKNGEPFLQLLLAINQDDGTFVRVLLAINRDNCRFLRLLLPINRDDCKTWFLTDITKSFK